MMTTTMNTKTLNTKTATVTKAKTGKTRALLAATALSAGVMSAGAQAEMFWSDNSVSILHSADYLNPFSGEDMEYTTMTLEHVSGHNWGDAFFFADRHHGKGSDADFAETYAELSPRFSLSSLSGAELKAGPIEDVFIATTYEFSSANSGFSQDNYLYGVGVKWSVPGFAFFNTNVYYANNSEKDNDMQLTVTYGVPFSLGEVDMMFDGYIDWSSAEETHGADLHINPQLRANIGKFMGITKSKLEAGIEYSYWSNKFGVRTSENQSAVSGIIKFHL